MKWILQNFAMPLLAAAVALLGNYWLVTKPGLAKDYTKIGVDILLQKDAPTHLRNLAEQLVSDNSPIPISKSDQAIQLENLLANIPFYTAEDIRTFGDLLAVGVVYIQWVKDISELCPECGSEDVFRERFVSATEKVHEMFDEPK